MSRKLNQQWNELLCRLMGHDLVDGNKYKSAKGEGCSKVCCRCGFYQNTVITPTPNTPSHQMRASHQ